MSAPNFSMNASAAAIRGSRIQPDRAGLREVSVELLVLHLVEQQGVVSVRVQCIVHQRFDQAPQLCTLDVSHLYGRNGHQKWPWKSIQMARWTVTPRLEP